MLDLNGQFRHILPRNHFWGDRLWMTGLVGSVLLLVLCQLGDLPLQDGDEANFAVATRDVLAALQTGSQSAQNSLFPPLVYWMTAFSYTIGGVNEVFSRLPNALLTAGSMPLIYGVARELFAGRMRSEERRVGKEC